MAAKIYLKIVMIGGGLNLTFSFFKLARYMALIVILFGSAFFVLNHTSQRETDLEAYVPQGNYEAAISDEQASPDSEAFQPIPDFENPVGFLDEKENLPSIAGDNEILLATPPHGGEEFIPHIDPSYLESDGKGDWENYIAKPNFELKYQEQDEALVSPQVFNLSRQDRFELGSLEGRFERVGYLRRNDKFELSLETKKDKPFSFELNVPSRRIEAIIKERKEVSVLALGRTTPTGRSESLIITTKDGLEYIFERQLGRSNLSASDRKDLEIRPVLSPLEKPVIQSSCRRAYEVFTEFGWSKKQIRLRAGEQGKLKSGNKQFTIAVIRSLANFPNDCGAAFEFVPYELEYVLWR